MDALFFASHVARQNGIVAPRRISAEDLHKQYRRPGWALAPLASPFGVVGAWVAILSLLPY